MWPPFTGECPLRSGGQSVYRLGDTKDCIRGVKPVNKFSVAIQDNLHALFMCPMHDINHQIVIANVYNTQ